MALTVIGGTGLIFSKAVERLRKKHHDVLTASPNGGVNTITGEGLSTAIAGAQVVIHLANSPSFEDKAVLELFETSEKQRDKRRYQCLRSSPSRHATPSPAVLH